MIGKIISQLLGNASDDSEVDDGYEELLEFEEGGWVIIKVSDEEPLAAPLADPMENLLIEHPSMSVYQRREETAEEEEEEGLPSDEEEEEEEEDTARSAVVHRHISWRLAAWGIPLVANVQLLDLRRARGQAERRKVSRGALRRQNLAKTRFSPAEKRYGHFKQPSQRLYNY